MNSIASNEKILVSVATPCFQTDLELFRRCMDSVMNQTLGFDKMEWVVTLHNSDAEYVSTVRKITEAYENIRVFELYDSWFSASTPRNCCLENCSGKYVFFLDSDDYLCSDAIQKLYEQMEEHGAQIGCFRVDLIPGSGEVLELQRMKTMQNQIRPVIILHRNDPEMAKFIEPRNLTIHKMYRLSFLREHNLSFLTGVRIAEDVLFNLSCLMYVDTIVFLPQYIGYIYQARAGSLLRSSDLMSLEVIPAWLNSIYLSMDMLLRLGMDCTLLAWQYLIFSVKLLSGPGVPQEIIAEWKPKIAVFVDQFPPIKGNKFCTQEELDRYIPWVKSYFADVVTSTDSNRNTEKLFEILRSNVDTDMGAEFRFHYLRTYEAFCHSVPPTDYSFYEPLVELTTRIGETGIFCKEPLVLYLLSSGSSGNQKRIPCTLSHLQTYTTAFRELLDEKRAAFALMESIPKKTEYADKTYSDSICGAILENLRESIGECSYLKTDKRGILTSPIEILFPEETIDPRYLRLLFALMEREVEQIVAFFNWEILDLMRYLEDNYEKLLEDIENGTISKDIPLPENMRKALEEKMKPCPERAAELRTEIEKGFAHIIPRIWPECSRIVAAGTGMFAIYKELLRKYTGDIPLNNGFFAASEAMIGLSMGNETDEYKMLTDDVFFEFLEVGGSEKPVDMEHIICGRDYEIILTNKAGLYRYRLGDVININRLEQGVPIFTFEYRLDEQCKIGNISVSGRNLAEAVRHIAGGTKTEIQDYCVMSEDDRLVLFIEPAPDSAATFKKLQKEEASCLIDDGLSAINSQYESKRKEGAIRPPVLKILQPNTQFHYRDYRLSKQGALRDQIKPVRVLDTEEKKEYFLNSLIGS